MLSYFDNQWFAQMPAIRMEPKRCNKNPALPEWWVKAGFIGPFAVPPDDMRIGYQPNEKASEDLRLLALEELEPEMAFQS